MSGGFGDLRTTLVSARTNTFRHTGTCYVWFHSLYAADNVHLCVFVLVCVSDHTMRVFHRGK